MDSMISDGVYSGSLDAVGYTGMVRQRKGAMVAGAFPVKPPTDWFTKPRLPHLTPLTIDKDGRVYGHIASWQQSHIGMAGSIKPPKSRSRYAFFQTGQLETADGDMIDVGQITLSGGHAPLDATVADAVAHYDNTRSAVMDVAAFEDKFGIVVAGALRPNVSDEQLREIRASAVSGDWRPINGNLELVAVCAVNVPGFPIPRARVAAGTPVALVAAGVEPLVELSMRRKQATRRPERDERPARASRRNVRKESKMTDTTPILAAMHSRLARLESQLAGAALVQRSVLDDAIVAAAGGNTKPDISELRARVHGVTASGAEDKAAELRKRVHKGR